MRAHAVMVCLLAGLIQPTAGSAQDFVKRRLDRMTSEFDQFMSAVNEMPQAKREELAKSLDQEYSDNWCRAKAGTKVALAPAAPVAAYATGHLLPLLKWGFDYNVRGQSFDESNRAREQWAGLNDFILLYGYLGETCLLITAKRNFLSSEYKIAQARDATRVPASVAANAEKPAGPEGGIAAPKRENKEPGRTYTEHGL
jgi:hypothetical protein